MIPATDIVSINYFVNFSSKDNGSLKVRLRIIKSFEKNFV